MLDPSLRGPAPFKVVSCPSSSPIFWGNAVLPPPTPAGDWRGDQGLGQELGRVPNPFPPKRVSLTPFLLISPHPPPSPGVVV